MDSIVKRFDFYQDKDLRICLNRGIAYQDSPAPIDYNSKEYQAKFAKYEQDKTRFNAINKGRVELVRKYSNSPALDIGAGSGAFVEAANKGGLKVFGFEINQDTAQKLQESGRFSKDFDKFDAFCMWDVLEHVPAPEKYFRYMAKDALLFVSIPIFSDITRVRESRHYRPNEHLYYFTDEGFRFYMASWGFEVCEISDLESIAGRDGIKTYVLTRSLPTYRDMLALYSQIHSEKFYGSSAILHFDQISQAVIKKNPATILDYGCGRSELSAYFWNDGKRAIFRYDPAIPEYKDMPRGTFDLVICCDVMEHIQLRDIDRVLSEIREKTQNAIFTISLRLARAKLPDGQNAHVSLLTKTEWTNWIKEYFGRANEVPGKYEHILTIRTF